MVSGYTELSSVTDSVNRGAIHKFLTKPWDDDTLRETVREAFQLYRVTRENTRLNVALREANDALTRWNHELGAFERDAKLLEYDRLASSF
jgi:FixJ family two-component response regulator